MRIGHELERQSEHALALTRAARDAPPEQARKLGELAASILHRIVAQGKPADMEGAKSSPR